MQKGFAAVTCRQDECARKRIPRRLHRALEVPEREIDERKHVRPSSTVFTYVSQAVKRLELTKLPQGSQSFAILRA